MTGTTLAEIGEFGFLDHVLPSLPTSPQVMLGPGDDCAVLRIDGQLAVSTDVLVEGVHFRRDWSSAREIGRKAVAVNVADLEAMGVQPVSLVIGLSAPGETEVSWLRELMAGVVEEAQIVGITLVGGDVTGSRDVTVCVTVMGQTGALPVVTRAGARVGDVVAICGRTGWAAAGLAVLQRGFRSPRAVVEAQRIPEPPYGQGRLAARSGATAMIDVSDGLVSDARHVCERSRVGINLRTSAFDVPEPIQAVCAAIGGDPMTFLLTGGEDHALLATFPSLTHVPDGWRVIGNVVEGDGVTVDGEQWEGNGGWDHYQH